jgi:hypothetical protein
MAQSVEGVAALLERSEPVEIASAIDLWERSLDPQQRALPRILGEPKPGLGPYLGEVAFAAAITRRTIAAMEAHLQKLAESVPLDD